MSRRHSLRCTWRCQVYTHTSRLGCVLGDHTLLTTANTLSQHSAPEPDKQEKGIESGWTPGVRQGGLQGREQDIFLNSGTIKCRSLEFSTMSSTTYLNTWCLPALPTRAEDPSQGIPVKATASGSQPTSISITPSPLHTDTGWMCGPVALSTHGARVQNHVFIFIRNVLGIKTIMRYTLSSGTITKHPGTELRVVGGRGRRAGGQDTWPTGKGRRAGCGPQDTHTGHWEDAALCNTLKIGFCFGFSVCVLIFFSFFFFHFCNK